MKITICGFYGAGNTGDEAILSAIIGSIKKIYPKCEFTVLSRNPAETKRLYKVDAVFMPGFGINWFQTDFKKISEIFKESDLIIVGGGGLLQDAHNYLSILGYLQVPILAKLHRKPVIFYSIGVGPIKNIMNKILVHIIGNIADLITVRDRYSKDYLRLLQVQKPSIVLSADPVFLLQPPSLARIKNLLIKEGIPIQKPIVGISVRNVEWTKVDLNEIAKFLDYVASHHKATILFIPFGYDGVPTDLDTSRKVIEKMKEKAYILEQRYSPSEIMGIVGQLSFLVGMRLHSIIMGGVMGVPTLGIAYLPKVKSALNILGYKDCHLIRDISDINFVHMRKIFNNILENEKKIKRNCRKSVKNLQNKAMEAPRLLKEIPNRNISKIKLFLIIFLFVISVTILGFLQLLKSRISPLIHQIRTYLLHKPLH